METQPKIQLNLASTLRNAGENYHEYHLYSEGADAISMCSMEELADQTQNNPNLFLRRFGFTAIRAVRTKLVEFQAKLDLADSEIRWLKRMGFIRVVQNDLKVDTSYLLPVLGWVQIVFFSLVFAPITLLAAFSAVTNGNDMPKFMLLIAMWLGVWTVMHRMYIKPWTLLRDREALVTDGTESEKKSER
jgi:hypothetical protein